MIYTIITVDTHCRNRNGPTPVKRSMYLSELLGKETEMAAASQFKETSS